MPACIDQTGESIEDIVSAYWRDYEAAHGESADETVAVRLFHAWKKVDEIERAGGQDLVDLLIALAETPPDGKRLMYLGAGPL